MVQIIDLFKSKKVMEIINYFIENQDAELYQSEISRKLKISRNTAFKWLNILNKKDILKTRISGKMKYFKLNKDNVIVKQIKILINVAMLSEILKYLKDEGVEVYLYGSVARGEDDKESDVDLLITGKMERKKLIKIVESSKKVLKKEVKPLVLTPLEYAELSRRDKVLYENIEKNKIRLL